VSLCLIQSRKTGEDCILLVCYNSALFLLDMGSLTYFLTPTNEYLEHGIRYLWVV